MKRLYVVIACNKYYEGRILPSLNTWMRGMGKDEDYVLMGEKSIPELNMVGFEDDDGHYCSIGKRKLRFIDEYRELLLNYDWITFIDDDAYLFRNRHKEFLKGYDHRKPHIIGHRMGREVTNRLDKNLYKYRLFHGGATITISSATVSESLLRVDKFRKVFYENLSPQERMFGDVAASYFASLSYSKPIVDKYLFNYRSYKMFRYKMKDFYKIISSHYLTEQDKYFLYDMEKDFAHV